MTQGLFRFLPLIVVLGVAAAEDDGFRVVKPEAIQWRAAPNMPGLSGATLAGDPSKPGPYVMRGRFAPGFINPPHRHDQERHIVVISGTWYVGTGETLDLENMQALPAGSFMVHPAGGAHYDGAKDGEVVVQISGVGPVSTDYIK
jgi:quercetin dioxygenase-like cupin family protein